MRHFRNILYIVDPTKQHQTALRRVVDGTRALQTKLHLYVCVPPPAHGAGEDSEFSLAEKQRYQLWLDHLAGPGRAQGVEISTEVELDDDWRNAVVNAAERNSADLIVKVTQPHTLFQRRLQKTSDWTLLRSASCPILFIKQDTTSTPKTLVAAVDIQETGEAHQRLTREVLRHAKGITDDTGAALHVVNAYSDQMQFVHPPELAKMAGIDRRNAHVGQCPPEDLLLEVLAGVADPVVVIGSSSRRSFSGSVLGNTAERILDKVPVDVLVVIAPR